MALEPLAGIRVVDLYAGSGALGIEALSRGAAFVDFVESNRGARHVLAGNLTELGLDARAAVWPLTLPHAVERLAEPLSRADLVLLDPPYGGDEARATLAALARAGLAVGARVVVEHHGRDRMPEREGRIVRERERKYGETVVSTYRVAAADAPAAASS